jgi:hypothetical protein
MTKLYTPEVFGEPTPACLLLTLVIPNLHSGGNLLAMIIYSHRDRFREKDVPALGEALSQLNMPSYMVLLIARSYATQWPSLRPKATTRHSAEVFSQGLMANPRFKILADQ